MTIRQSLKQRGKLGNIRWTSTRRSRRQKLDDDVKISMVLGEAPTKLRDNLLVNSQQFESDCNKLRATIQVYLNSNKSWIATDSRNDMKESDPMEVDIGNGNGNVKSKRQRSEVRQAR